MWGGVSNAAALLLRNTRWEVDVVPSMAIVALPS